MPNKTLRSVIDHFFTKRVTVFKWQLNLFAFICVSIGIGVGVFAMLSNVFTYLMALGQDTRVVSTDTHFNDGTLTDIEVSGTGESARLQLATGGGENWYDVNWSSRREITFDNSGQSENLVDFPVLIKLTTVNFDFSDANSDGSDIRFTDSDGVTLLDYDIEEWDSDLSQPKDIYVKVPQIDAGSTTDSIYIYYGNSGASSAEDPAAVWGEMTRWYFDENEIVSGTTITDESSNDTDLTTVNGAASEDAKVGPGLSFAGPGGSEYLVQKTWDSEQGSLSLSETTLQDSKQEFDDWDTASGDAAYMIKMQDSVSSTAWAFLGEGVAIGADGETVVYDGINLYEDIGLTTPGLNGSIATPVSYEIWDTDTHFVSDFTMGIWAKPDNASIFSSEYLMSKSESVSVHYRFRRNSSEGFDAYASGAGIDVDSLQYADTDWHFVVVSYDAGSRAKIYVDGDLEFTDETVNSSMPGQDIKFAIGAIGGDGGYYFDGTLDEPFVTKSVLSDDWVKAMFLSESAEFATVGEEDTALAPTGTWESSDSDPIDLYWNGGWGDGTGESTAFSATVADVSADGYLTFYIRSSSTVAGLSEEIYCNMGTVTTGTTFSATKSELDSCGVGDGSNRYVQVKAGFTSDDGITNPKLDDFTISYMSDTDGPTQNPVTTVYTDSGMGTEIPGDSWTNDADPYFTFSGADDALPADENSGIEGYCVYFGTEGDADPLISKGLLGDTEQAGDNSGCPYVTYNSYIDLSTALSSDLTDDTYYLNVRAKDYAGNLYTGENYTIFTYQFDETDPTNPAGLSAPQTYQKDIESISVYWSTSGPTAAADNLSGVKGFQYKIGDVGTWYGSGHTGSEDCSDLITTGSYTLDADFDSLDQGENVFYLRTYDNACNVTDTGISAILKYSGTAPTEPQNLAVDPTTNTVNLFAFSWAAPETYSGLEEGLSYCYTVNTLPSAETCSWTDSTSLGADAYATQPGTNTFYVVAKDEAGNVNYNAYSSVNFMANTEAPGVPESVEVLDISIKASANWRLAVSWEEPENVGAGVENYKVYRSGTPASCATQMGSFSLIGSTAGTTYSDYGLSQQEYFYCVKACDSSNNCGAPSQTVSETPTGKYYEPANLVSQPTVSNISTHRATITWVTDRSSDSKLQYGLGSGEYFEVEAYNSEQTTVHVLTLENLSAGTTYWFRAKWTDEDGNTGISDERSFTTEPPPVVKEVSATNIGLDSAMIEFTVVGAHQANLYYGTSADFGAVKEVTVSPLESTYTVVLTGLSDGTKYFYRIDPVDLDGTEYDGTVLDFTTMPRPRISSVQIQEVKGTAQPTVEVYWESNTAISSIVSYYPKDDPDFLQDSVDVELVEGEHEMRIKGLTAETEYVMTVRGRDRMGNEAVSDEYYFTTATDSRPPEISNLKVEGTIVSEGVAVGEEGRAQLVISWDTDEPATSQVEYAEGTGSDYSQSSQRDTNLTYNHIVVISGLSPSKVYHFRALSKDTIGNEGASEDVVSVTPKDSESAFELVINNLIDIFGFLK